MAALIPSLGSCTFDSGGERRLAERLVEKLEDDYLCWYNVPLGPAVRHPDFIVFHPRRGLLILEVKDWKKGTILAADRQRFTLATARGEVAVENPLEQARQYAQAAVSVLQRDPQLVFSSGREAGNLRFPWSYGVVLPNLTRRQFEEGGLGEVIPEARVICQDEMLETVDPEAFQQRLWAMFSVRFQSALSPTQIDRLRWALFPEVRIPAAQGELALDPAGEAPPDLVRVMDLQQEQLARSLGEGHRVIHGVAGSGKTLILLYRAEHLAHLVSKPVLVLCYNEALARRLASVVAAKGLAETVWVHHFHHWCRALLAAHELELPPRGDDAAAYCAGLVERALAAVADGRIEGGQYAAILIDEGHDFAPDWFRLLVPLVDPQTNSLLVLYDDAQSIYADAAEGKGGEGNEGAWPRRRFSFKRVGIQAQGRTTILRINYRNPEAILRFARATAWPALAPTEADSEDGVPRLEPLSAGGAGEVPQVVHLPSAQAEAEFVVRHLQAAHRAGTPWGEMAVIYRDYYRDAKTIRKLLPRHGVPTVYFDDATHADDEDKVTLITMHSCKGLEYSLVVIPGADRLGLPGEPSAPEARLLYVAMTRATRALVLCGVGAEAEARPGS